MKIPETVHHSLGAANYVLAFAQAAPPEQSQIWQLKIRGRKERGLVIAFLQEARTDGAEGEEVGELESMLLCLH